MPGLHDKIIADVAKSTLGPFHFRRKGRSRTWLADHGWWLTVVEFQPSSWSKGTYLNVAAHWLWSETDHMSFDFGGRVAGFEEYQTVGQFTQEANRLAECASLEAQRLQHKFESLAKTANVLAADVWDSGKSRTGHPGWRAYNAGVALALTGCSKEAMEMFDSVRSWPIKGSLLYLAAERMAQSADNRIELEGVVRALIESTRKALSLPPCSDEFA